MAGLGRPQGSATRERILETAEKLILGRGYVGTSIDDILKATGLTKGGFFYHFKNKAELSMAVVERYAAKDFELFESFSARANECSDDPLDRLMAFLTLFETFIEEMNEPPGGCIFASYIYEADQFNDAIKKYITDGFAYWGDMYIEYFDAVKAKYPSAVEVDSKELSETIMSLIEGAFILAKSTDDAQVIARCCSHFRRYIELLFQRT